MAAGLALLAVLGAVGGALPQFTDIASTAGLTDVFYCGGDVSKKYILETLAARGKKTLSQICD